MEDELNTEKEGKIKSRFDKYIIKENLIIKDSTFFKDDTPPKMVERKEIDDFYRELGVFVNYRKSNNILLKGYPGSGKTVTINFVKGTITLFLPDDDTEHKFSLLNILMSLKN